MKDLYVVTVDTRGRSSSDIKGFQEHVCPKSFFEESVELHPEAMVFSSPVGQFCGLDIKVIFHKSPPPENNENSKKKLPEINRAATLLTLDPDTGTPVHQVRGIAYVLRDDGKYPLSFRQVWGLQELINYGMDHYRAHPETPAEGRRHLLRYCREYKRKAWGPLSIYQNRQKRVIHMSDLPPKPQKSAEANEEEEEEEAQPPVEALVPQSPASRQALESH